MRATVPCGQIFLSALRSEIRESPCPALRWRIVQLRCRSMEFEVPLTIECVDCLGTCHRLPREPEGGFAPGEVIPYRCEDCLDRWDIQFDSEEA